MLSMQDAAEEWSVMHHMPCQHERDMYTMMSYQLIDKDGFSRALDGFWLCLGEGISRNDWDWERERLEIALSTQDAERVVSPAMLWSDTAHDAMLHEYIHTRRWTPFKLFYELAKGGAHCAAAIRLDGLEQYSGTLVVPNFDMLSAEEKQAVAAYDRGNKSIIITGQTSLVDTIEEEGGIISVDQNDAGFLAVTRDDDYYRSVVNVYDNSQNLIYQWKTSDYYLLRAVLSPDSKHIAVAALTQDGGEFQSKIIFFDLSREEFGASYVMDGSLATNMYFLDNEKLCIIGDNRAAVIDTLGLEVCVYEYGNDMLKTYASGSDCVVLALTDRTSGLGSKLVTISASTDKPIIRSTDDAVRKLSVSGDYIAVLYTQSTEVYNKELKPYGQPVEVYGVRDLLINDEGKVLLIYSSEAGYVDFITPFLSHENASAIK